MITTLWALVSLAGLSSPVDDGIWLEAETPSATNIRVEPNASAAPERLSNRQWVTVSAEGDDNAKFPAEGVQFSYDFTSASAGPRTVHARIGFEFARSPLEWRVNDGSWQTLASDALTSDLVPLSDWTEVAWIPLGTSPVRAGQNKLEVRVRPRKNEKGEWQRLLFGADAFYIAAQPFFPNGPHRPGTDWQTDRDRAAGRQVFQVPAPAASTVSKTPLNGDWEVARHDEQAPPFDIAVPMEGQPERAYWSAIPVPSDRNVSRPDLMFAHRLWFRTRINLPANLAGRSVVLEFPRNNLNSTVVVNGVTCGFSRNPLIGFRADITRAAKPGVNEVLVGIRDAWYGYSTNPTDPMKLRRKFNLPLSFTRNGFQDLAYPIFNGFMSGILETPTVEIGGNAYADDVFVRPSVAQKRLDATVRVMNPTDFPVAATVSAEVVDVKTGAIAKALPPVRTNLPARAHTDVEIGDTWANPTLWWPDAPHLYYLRTRVVSTGEPDVRDTRFGFREWGHRGNQFTLNGQNWVGWAELTEGQTKEEWLANYRATGQRFQRLAGVSQNGGITWKGLSFDETLRWADENGVVWRRSGDLDGQIIGYMAVENDPDLRQLYGSETKVQLFKNWKEQMVAQVRRERNHPSIHIWSVENEFLYINCINLYGGLMDEFERRVKEVGDGVLAADPTRLWMVDGGGAGKDQLFPVHGDHYIYTNDPSAYPDLAYSDFPTGGGRGRWVYDNQRPRYAGEDFFATGINPADYAWIGGEKAFLGKVAAHEGIARIQRFLTEGYRWHGGMVAMHFWVGMEGSQYGKHVSNAERAAFVREYDTTFASESPVKRTVGIFNDSRFADPMVFRAELKRGSETIHRIEETVALTPGTRSVRNVTVPLPKVGSRTPLTWELTLTVGPTVVFKDQKAWNVIPDPSFGGIAAVGLYDPAGQLGPWLQRMRVPAVPVTDLASVPTNVRVLVVAKDALTAAQATDTVLARIAVTGRRVIVLEQAEPVRFQALPSALEPTGNAGHYAFPEVATHPTLVNLVDSDFMAWSGDGRVFRRTYVKPLRGATSIIQAHRRLNETPLLEVPVGDGVVVLSQLAVQERLDSSPVARHLLANYLRYGHAYRAPDRAVTAFVPESPALKDALNSIGVRYQPAADVLAAIAKPGVAVVQATPANLAALVANRAQLDKFLAGKGSLVLSGLTPAGLASFNQLVGVQHQIRPMRAERTTIRFPRDPLAVGISLGDTAMMSSTRLFAWTSDMVVASDSFDYIVDTDDVAAFATLPNPELYNTVNGLVSADGWPYIYSFGLDSQQPVYTMTWPAPQELTELEWTGNGFYHLVTKIELTFSDGSKQTFDVKPNTDPQTLVLPAAKSTDKLTLRIVDWIRVPTATQNVVGIDNIRLRVKRSADWERRVHPLMNVGALVRYEVGGGDIVLANVKWQETETVPENRGKKQRILAAILRNLRAPFGSGKVVVAGAPGVQYQPIDLAGKANQFRNQRGWFGDPNRTFAALPTGPQTFAGVPFTVYEFATSPVPNAVMLGADGVPGNLPDRVEGIPVNGKFASLFFLQTARIDRRLPEWEAREGKTLEMARYVITYADGQTVTIPLRVGIELESFVQTAPKELPGARIAWTAKYPDSDQTAVAYQLQWNNPRPDVVIASIALTYGPDKAGVPVLLAVTGAR